MFSAKSVVAILFIMLLQVNIMSLYSGMTFQSHSVQSLEQPRDRRAYDRL